ncbi:MAG TPA: chorismate mutase [Candidatus Angelobacter sp.]|nr:chorismate mutase [Candidatus Angelobacter sp.]
MDITDWRKKIDVLDGRLVELLNERAVCAVEIGKLKRSSALPVYEPDREKVIFENVCKVNHGPLPDKELQRVYERILDVMRNIQKIETAAAGGVKSDTEVKN